jgi:hypothetical protein
MERGENGMNCTDGHDWTEPDLRRRSDCRRCGANCTRGRDGTIETFSATGDLARQLRVAEVNRNRRNPKKAP